MKLSGQVTVVTGALSGIGQDAAIGLARVGAKVVLAGRSAEAEQNIRPNEKGGWRGSRVSHRHNYLERQQRPLQIRAKYV